MIDENETLQQSPRREASAHERLVMLPDGYKHNGDARPWRRAKVLAYSGPFAEVEYLDNGLRIWVARTCFEGIAA